MEESAPDSLGAWNCRLDSDGDDWFRPQVCYKVKQAKILGDRRLYETILDSNDKYLFVSITHNAISPMHYAWAGTAAAIQSDLSHHVRCRSVSVLLSIANCSSSAKLGNGPTPVLIPNLLFYVVGGQSARFVGKQSHSDVMETPDLAKNRKQVLNAKCRKSKDFLQKWASYDLCQGSRLLSVVSWLILEQRLHCLPLSKFWVFKILYLRYVGSWSSFLNYLCPVFKGFICPSDSFIDHRLR